MDTLSREGLKELMEKANGLCVSIFMSTRRGGAEAQQNPIRFKNLLKKAEEDLIARGLRSPETRKMLDPAQRLLLDDFFWRQSDGIAVFLSIKMFRYYKLPFNTDELLVISDRFYIKPLLRLIANEERFYILAISQNMIKLFQGNRQNLTEVELDGIPKSLSEALKYDDFGKELQFHSGSSGGAPIFHSTDFYDAKDNILRYFRQVNKGLHELVRNKKAPLLLAGVEYLFPIYRGGEQLSISSRQGDRGQSRKDERRGIAQAGVGDCEANLLKGTRGCGQPLQTACRHRVYVQRCHGNRAGSLSRQSRAVVCRCRASAVGCL